MSNITPEHDIFLPDLFENYDRVEFEVDLERAYRERLEETPAFGRHRYRAGGRLRNHEVFLHLRWHDANYLCGHDVARRPR